MGNSSNNEQVFSIERVHVAQKAICKLNHNSKQNAFIYVWVWLVKVKLG